MAIPDPPDVSSFEPAMMTASELTTELEKLFHWLELVEAEEDGAARLSEQQVETVRNAANELLAERRDRHSDETAPRGG